MSYELTEAQRARIIAGAALLDEKVPGWQEQIDLSLLDVDHTLNCVLGQLFGNFYEGRPRLVTGKQGAIDHGFYPDMIDEVQQSNRREIAAARTDYWRTLIRNRLS